MKSDNLQDNPFYYLPNSRLFPGIGTTAIEVSESKPEILLAQEALALYIDGKLSDAHELYNKAITLYPELPFFYACRSILNSEQGDDEGAFYDYQVAKNLDFNYHIFLEWMGNKGEMEYSAELEEFSALLEKGELTAQEYINRGMLLVQHFNYSEAVADFSKAIAFEAGNTELYISRGAVYMRMLQYDKAYLDFNTALQLDRDSHLGYLYLAKLLMAIQENELALANFDKAVLLRPDDVIIYEDRALFYEKNKDYAKAAADYSKLISLSPEEFYGYVLRAEVYEHLMRWHDALKDYDKAIALNPYYSDLYGYRADIKERLGDKAGAELDRRKFEELEED